MVRESGIERAHRIINEKLYTTYTLGLNRFTDLELAEMWDVTDQGYRIYVQNHPAVQSTSEYRRMGEFAQMQSIIGGLLLAHYVKLLLENNHDK